MNTSRRGRTFLGVVFAAVLAMILSSGCVTKNQDSSQERTKLGTVPS